MGRVSEETRRMKSKEKVRVSASKRKAAHSEA